MFFFALLLRFIEISLFTGFIHPRPDGPWWKEDLASGNDPSLFADVEICQMSCFNKWDSTFFCFVLGMEVCVRAPNERVFLVFDWRAN